MISQKNSESQRDHTASLSDVRCVRPRAVSPYDRDVSHEQAESYSKTQESLSRVSSQVKAMDRMTSYHKGKRKDLESTKGSKTGNGGIDWTLRKRMQH